MDDDVRIRQRKLLTNVVMYVVFGLAVALFLWSSWLETHAPLEPNAGTGETAFVRSHNHEFYVRPYLTSIFDGRAFFALWFIGFCVAAATAVDQEPAERTLRSYWAIGCFVLLLAGIVVVGFSLWQSIFRVFLGH